MFVHTAVSLSRILMGFVSCKGVSKNNYNPISTIPFPFYTFFPTHGYIVGLRVHFVSKSDFFGGTYVELIFTAS